MFRPNLILHIFRATVLHICNI